MENDLIGRKQNILGVNVLFGLDLEKACAQIASLVKSGGCHTIVTVNPEFIMDAQKDSEFCQILNNATLALPDGVGVLMASYYYDLVSTLPKDMLFPVKAFLAGVWCGVRVGLLGFRNEELIPGRILVEKLCEISAKRGYSVGFLGGSLRNNKGVVSTKSTLGVADRARSYIINKYPSANVVFASSDFKSSTEDDVATLNMISEELSKNKLSSLDMLFVAYNHVYQEKWINRNSAKIPARVSIGVGGTLDYFAGIQHAPSKWVKKINMEWLARLLHSPWRFKRILKAFPLFPLLVFLSRLKSSSSVK